MGKVTEMMKLLGVVTLGLGSEDSKKKYGRAAASSARMPFTHSLQELVSHRVN